MDQLITEKRIFVAKLFCSDSDHHVKLFGQRVSQKRLPLQIQINALIQTTYCGSLKLIVSFERRMNKNTHFYTHGR